MLDFCYHAIGKICQGAHKRQRRHYPMHQDLELAETLLQRMEREKEHVVDANRALSDSLPLSSTSYNRLIRAWAQTPSRQSNNHNSWTPLEQANRILQRLKRKHQERPDVYPSPDTHSYSAVLYACTLNALDENIRNVNVDWKEVSTMDRVERFDTTSQLANTLLQQVQDSARQNPHGPIQATYALYNNMILMHANQAATRYGAAAEAEDWLLYLSDLDTQGQHEFRPATPAFNRVLKAWSIASTKMDKDYQDTKGADRALEILDLMIKLGDVASPDVVSFTTVISAFAKRNRPVEAQGVLQKALDYFATSGAIESESIDLTPCLNAAITAWSCFQADEIDPDMDAFVRIGALLHGAYALGPQQQNQKGPQDQSENSLGENIRLVPDALSHVKYLEALINLQSQTPETRTPVGDHEQADVGIDRAERHLRELLNIRDIVPPISISSFHVVLRGWSQSDRPERGEKALALLSDMMRAAEVRGLHCHPTTETINLVLEILLSLLDRPEALSNLFQVLQKAEVRNLTNHTSYHRTVNSLCQVGTKDSAFAAARVLAMYEGQVDKRETLKWDPRQTVGLYTAVLTQLSRLGTIEAAELALQTLLNIPREGKRAMEPSISTFTAVIRAFSNLRNHEDRCSEVTFEIFQKIKDLHRDTKSKVSFDGISFKVILMALSNTRNEESAEKIVNVLTFFLELLHSGNPNVEPGAGALKKSLSTLEHCADEQTFGMAVKLLRALLLCHQKGNLSECPTSSELLGILKKWEEAISQKRCGSPELLKEIEQVDEAIRSISSRP